MSKLGRFGISESEAYSNMRLVHVGETPHATWHIHSVGNTFLLGMQIFLFSGPSLLRGTYQPFLVRFHAAEGCPMISHPHLFSANVQKIRVTLGARVECCINELIHDLSDRATCVTHLRPAEATRPRTRSLKRQGYKQKAVLRGCRDGLDLGGLGVSLRLCQFYVTFSDYRSVVDCASPSYSEGTFRLVHLADYFKPVLGGRWPDSWHTPD